MDYFVPSATLGSMLREGCFDHLMATDVSCTDPSRVRVSTVFSWAPQGRAELPESAGESICAGHAPECNVSSTMGLPLAEVVFLKSHLGNICQGEEKGMPGS